MKSSGGRNLNPSILASLVLLNVRVPPRGGRFSFPIHIRSNFYILVIGRG